MTERLLNSFDIIQSNLQHINDNIKKTCDVNNIDFNDINLLAATKTVSADRINFAISNGVKYIGENKVQELLSKYCDYDLNRAELHFIGHLQTNKVKDVVDKVSLIQSVDSVRLASKISSEAQKIDKVIDVLVEINVGDESSKSGVSLDCAAELIDEISAFDGIKVRGLMTIPPICDNTAQLLKYFSNMYNLFVDIKSKKVDNVYMDYLSMGMSSDYCEAISCGANFVRIGSSIFGERHYNNGGLN